MAKILLIDDDEIMHITVKGIVGTEHTVISCFTMKEAEEYFSGNNTASLIIIDRVLPDGDGINLCAQLRSEVRLRSIPIIFLSSRDTETDRVGGLFAGADDYICKPVAPLELKARIQARLRNHNQQIHLGNLVIDPFAHRTFIQGSQPEEIELTRLEFKILLTLGKYPDRAFSRESLIDHVWGHAVSITDRVVDTHICNLRKKIQHSGVKIRSLRGEGYILYISENRQSA